MNVRTRESALRNGVYRRLLTAQVVSLAGTGLATVALGLLAYDVAGGGAGRVLGTVFAIKMVAYVVVAPVAHALVSRLPRRAVMVAADVLRAAVAVMLPFVDQVWQVYLLVFVLQAASAVHTPTFQAAVPDVLPDVRQYTQALSFSRLAEDLEMVLSPMLAAALLLVVPHDALFWGTAIGFGASAVLIASIAIPRAAPPSGGGHGFDELPFGARVRHGAALMWRIRALRPVLALNLAVAAGGAFVLVQTVVIARETFGQGNDVVALLLAVNGAGSMTAALTLPRVLGRMTERRVMLGGSAVLAAATLLVPLALGSGSTGLGLAAVGVLWFAVGLGWACTEVPFGRLVVREVPEAERPAVFAAEFSLSHACWLVTYPLAGWLGAVGLGPTALLLAVVAAGAVVAGARLWPATAAVTAA
ncbi:MFS transporter [Xylanimonas sp. McL0601]|uniref:MFS transporter n=1 Tax=Xylanimonas sp. McL0601 TaxID=3414739 RepID=UPI003CF16DCF